MNEKTCVLIIGPTAVGKTSAAINLAKDLNTSIISADSRQCFRELNIGVAKPSPSELDSVRHYFINSHSVHDVVNAALFENLSLQWTKEIFNHNQFAIVTGGTGLYLKAFADGLDAMPPSNAEVRLEIQEAFLVSGIEWLQEAVEKEDPDFFSTAEIHNPQRLIRALEVKRISGRSIRSYQSAGKKTRPFRIIKIGLELPRDQLYENINSRVDRMIGDGLVEEVKGLVPMRHLNALQTVGYSELFQHFDGVIGMEEAIDLIKQNSRHYAKRQLTWFRKDPEIQWIDAMKTKNLKEAITLLVKTP